MAEWEREVRECFVAVSVAAMARLDRTVSYLLSGQRFNKRKRTVESEDGSTLGNDVVFVGSDAMGVVETIEDHGLLDVSKKR